MINKHNLMIGNTVQSSVGLCTVVSLNEKTAKLKSKLPFSFTRKYGKLDGVVLNEQVLESIGFEDWGQGTIYVNEFQSYKRFVLFNVIDGTSNFEVHIEKSNYGGLEQTEFLVSIDAVSYTHLTLPTTPYV